MAFNQYVPTGSRRVLAASKGWQRRSESPPRPKPTQGYIAVPIERDDVMEMERHEMMEEALGDMVGTVRKLGIMGQQINTELVDQNAMVEDLNADAAEAQVRVDIVTRKLNKLIQKSGFSRLKIIIFLSVILLFLIFLVLYT